MNHTYHETCQRCKARYQECGKPCRYCGVVMPSSAISITAVPTSIVVDYQYEWNTLYQPPSNH